VKVVSAAAVGPPQVTADQDEAEKVKLVVAAEETEVKAMQKQTQTIAGKLRHMAESPMMTTDIPCAHLPWHVQTVSQDCCSSRCQVLSDVDVKVALPVVVGAV
jgi:hypothetical protein